MNGQSFAAKVQFINNVPNEKLDIYINDQLQFPNMKFRQGTAFFSLPDGEWVLAVAPADSESAEDALENFIISLVDSTNYVFMFSGEAEDLKLFTRAQHRFSSDAAQHVGISFIHAALPTDSVTISISEQELWSGLVFGNYTPYINIPSSAFSIVIEDAAHRKGIISNWINLDFWQQRSAIIFTSGYTDGRSPRLKTYVMLSNGVSFPLEEISLPEAHRKVGVQFIQNAYQERFDLYLNDELFINDFSPKDATAFLDLPKGEYFSIGLANAASNSSFDIQNYFNFKLEEDLDYLIFLHQSEDTNTIFPRIKNKVPKDVFSGSVALAFSQAATHLDAVDVYIDDEKIYQNIDQWRISDYYLLPSRPFRLDVKKAGNTNDNLASYLIDLGKWRGSSAMLYTSTKVDAFPSEIQLHVVLADTTFEIAAMQNIDGIEQRKEGPAKAWMTTNIHQRQLNIQYQGFEEQFSHFVLIDASGKEVLKQMEAASSGYQRSIQIDVKSFISGTYILKAYIDDQVFTEKILIR